MRKTEVCHNQNGYKTRRERKENKNRRKSILAMRMGTISMLWALLIPSCRLRKCLFRWVGNNYSARDLSPTLRHPGALPTLGSDIRIWKGYSAILTHLRAGKIGLHHLIRLNPRCACRNSTVCTAFPARRPILLRPTTNGLGGREEERSGIVKWREMLSHTPFHSESGAVYIENRSVFLGNLKF